MGPRLGKPLSRQELRAQVNQHQVHFRSSHESLFMSFAGLFMRLLGQKDFLRRVWLTLGRTIYHPSFVDDPYAYPGTVEHELVHVRQWRKYGPLFGLAYLLLPLPLGLSWFRWYFEREAYLVQLRICPDEAEVERLVEVLWRGYGYPWPRPWMRSWFRRKLLQWADSRRLGR